MAKKTDDSTDDDYAERSEGDVLRELDAKLDGLSAVIEELAVNQQTLAKRLAERGGESPSLDTRNTSLYITSNGQGSVLTVLLQSRRTFTLFAKCCQKTCSFTI